MIFGFDGIDCPDAEEARALAMRDKGRINVLTMRNPLKQKADCVRELTVTPVDDVNFATRFRALSVEIAGQSAIIWLDLEVAFGGVSAKIQPLRLIQPCRRCVETSE